MSDPFSRHGITHLSPTAINTFAEQPAAWAFKYLLSEKDEAGASAWRGSAVEAGLDYWLFKKDAELANRMALDRFELDAAGLCDNATDRERNRICPMLMRAMLATGEFDPPTLRQERVEFWLDGIEVPIVGVIDYEWEKFGLDLKTTAAMPTRIRDGHARQISVYQAARKKPYKILYVTEQKHEIKELSSEESERQLKHIAWYAHNIRRGLATFTDKMELARIYLPNFNHPYLWKNEQTKARAMEIWDVQF